MTISRAYIRACVLQSFRASAASPVAELPAPDERLAPTLLPPQASSQDQEQYDNGMDQASADSTQPPTDDDVQYFQSDLQPYGDWVVTADFGRVFRPHGLVVGWRPYSVGHWVYTDTNGWLWVSDEPFGWATYHYGRWAVIDGGWAWVPGRVWGPAWVAWRHGGGYCGWAPIPAVRRGGVAVGISLQVGGIGAANFLFVDEAHVCEPRIYGYIHPAHDNITIINRTTNITNITYVNGHVVNHAVDVREVERVSGRRVAHVRVVDSSSRGGQARQNWATRFRSSAPRLPAMPRPLMKLKPRRSNTIAPSALTPRTSIPSPP